MFWLWFLAIVGFIFVVQWYLFRKPDGEPYVGNSNATIDESLAGTAVSNSHFTRFASSFRTGEESIVLENLVLKVRCLAGESVTLRVLLYESGEHGPAGTNLIEKWPVQTYSGGHFGHVTFLRAANQRLILRPETTYWIAFYNNNTAGGTSAEWARTTTNEMDDESKMATSIPSNSNFMSSVSRGERWLPDESGAPGVFQVHVSRALPGSNRIP